jgi:hypothetical protein
MYEIKKNLAGDKDFARLLFVLKALSPKRDPHRAYTSVLHVERLRGGARLIATDGKRLHVAGSGIKIKAGDYSAKITKDAVTLNPEKDVLFPNWKRVIPAKPVCRGTINLESTGIGDYELSSGLSSAFHSLIRKTGEAVNIRHLEELPKTRWLVFVAQEKEQPIMLRQNEAERETFAVIAPLHREAA